MNKPMTSAHPNMALFERLSKNFPHDLDNLGDVIAEDFILHYYNSQIPDLDGDYKGIDGLKNLFQKLGTMTRGNFKVIDGQLIHMGDELIVLHATHKMTVADNSFEVDAVVVWRVVENHFAEAWDIPAVNTIRPVT